jgi:hypothetical protein
MTRNSTTSNKSRRFSTIWIVIIVCLFATFALAQRPPRKPSAQGPRLTEVPANEEDLSGRFTFARARFDIGLSMGYRAFLGDGGLPWSHDYPIAGRHLMKIMTELSKADVTIDKNEPIFAFDDPEIFKYPFIYLCEVGFMDLKDTEIAGLREYCLRGGFVMVDDFRQEHEFQALRYNLQRAFPEYQLKRLDGTHPIFNCFFSIKTLDIAPMYGPYRPEFWGLEDETGRLMMVVDYNYDMSDYWQWSDNPFRPIEETNESYKFGVNYIIYSLTH